MYIYIHVISDSGWKIKCPITGASPQIGYQTQTFDHMPQALVEKVQRHSDWLYGGNCAFGV